jgi:hypothetical protein
LVLNTHSKVECPTIISRASPGKEVLVPTDYLCTDYKYVNLN